MPFWGPYEYPWSPGAQTPNLGVNFISSRLDYCNSLLYGVNDGLLKKLQAVQNAAARMTTER